MSTVVRYTRPTVLGIDPGGRNTGMVARNDLACQGWAIVEGDALTDLPTVIRGIRAFAETIVGEFMVAVEGVQKPNAYQDGKLKMTNVTPLLGTSMVLGAVVTMWPDAVIVPPGGNGSAPLRSYPKVLVGPREGPAGAGKLRHCRSAWDVAGSGVRLASMARRMRAN